MYILSLVISTGLLFPLAKLDKIASKKYDNIEPDEYDTWIENFSGRKKVYIILFILNLIPGLNFILSCVYTLAVVIVMCLIIFKSERFQKIIDRIL